MLPSGATAMAVAPDGSIFVTLRQTGVVSLIRDGRVIANFAQVQVTAGGERGLLGVALDPGFPSQPFVYVFFTDSAAGGSPRSRIARLTDVADRAADVTVIFDNIPAASIHNGGILAFGPDGKLYVTLGDHTQSATAQDIGSLNGKVLRINPDGTIPSDNPFPGSPVFTLGHRNVFGLAFDPIGGRPFITENGPTDNDEVNILQAGGNYGWPTVRGIAHDPRFIDPIYAFVQEVAPTNAAFYTGNALPPELRNDFLFGDYLHGGIHRFVLDASRSRVVLHEVVYTNPSGPVLDVKVGPGGYLYFNTGAAIERLVNSSANNGTAGNSGAGIPIDVLPWVAAVALASATVAYVIIRGTRRKGRRPPP
jgi:glucose/arabinose dehydrogenase